MRKKVGLFTLGITLVLCGTTILLTRYTDIRLFKDIFLLWPAFLILLGLEFIFTKLWYDSKKQDVQLSPSGISIFLAIVVLFISSIWTNWSNWVDWSNWSNPGRHVPHIPDFHVDLDGDWAGLYSDSVEDTVKVEPDLSDLQRILVSNERGTVDIQPSEDGQLRLEAKIRIDTNNKDEAYALLPDIITVDHRNRTATVTAKNPVAGKDHSLRYVNMTLWVPGNAELDLSTEFDRISVRDMENNVTVRQQHGDITLENIGGNAAINSSFAGIRAAGVTGDLEITNLHGGVQAENISGSVKIENSFDATRVQQVGKDLTVKSRHGEVWAEDVRGSVSIENEYESIHCGKVDGNLKVWAQHSAVTLEDIKGNIHAETAYDDIRLANPSYAEADLKASTSFGSIRGGEEIHLKVSDPGTSQEASVVNGSGNQEIQLKNQYGDIRID